MTSMRRFSVFDLLRFNNVNLDPLTETYNMGFYLQYIAKWPEYCFVADGPTGRSMGYVLGKAEDFQDKPDSWHGHVTAVTVPPEYRRLGMATQLMHVLERGSRTNRRPSHARAHTQPHPAPRPASQLRSTAAATSSTSSFASRTRSRSACTPRWGTRCTGR